MIKTYKSNTPCVLSISLSNGGYRYVNFKPLSRGGGIYITPNKLEQEALEKHKLFGIRYQLTMTELTAEEKAAESTSKKAEEVEEEKKEEAVQEQATTTVEVNDIEEARDYLNEHFGVAKRYMRSTAAVKAMAEQNGIIFKGI